MLNRRHIRMKVMQTLYAAMQKEDTNIALYEKELVKSMERVYDLYAYMLLFMVKLKHAAEDRIEKNKAKKLPSQDDLNPNLKFVNNVILNALENNQRLNKYVEDNAIGWAEEKDLIKKVFNEIRESDLYQEYMNSDRVAFSEDRKFIAQLFIDFVAPNEQLHHIFEEKSIYWVDDLPLINSMVLRTIQSAKKETEQVITLMDLYKDPEDIGFAKELFRKTLLNEKEYTAMIVEKAKNWEVDRIAAMDILLMRMGITELINFNSIPTKVTLNEYIELSKDYSTPKSKVFINGILDKLVADLTKENKIKKIGRGLM